MRVHTDISRVPVSVAPSPATSGTSLGVTDANAAYLPDTYPYWAVLVPTGAAPTRANSEIVKVTEGSSSGGTTTLTIVRAQGIPVTTAQSITTSFDIYDANSVEAIQTAAAIVENEVPGGTINSSNTAFTSAASFITGSLKVYQNGVRLKGGGVDFTEGTGVNFTFVTAPTTGDTILIDYKTSAGTFTTGSTSFVYNEVPSGLVNGSNTAYDTAHTYVAGSIQVYRDGQLMTGGGADYTETDSNTITFTTAPVTGSVILCTYQSAVSTAGNADTLDGYHANATPTANNIPVLDAVAAIPIAAANGAWVYPNHTWAYVSASSFKISGVDVTAFYKKGMPIRWKQGGAYKYGNIAADATFSTDTTVTIVVNTDFTIANSAITDNYISYSPTPLGFPCWFNFTASLSGWSANPSYVYRYSISGTLCSIVFACSTNGTSNAASTYASLPIISKNVANISWRSYALVVDNGTVIDGSSIIIPNDNNVTFQKAANNYIFTASGNKSCNTIITYEF